MKLASASPKTEAKLTELQANHPNGRVGPMGWMAEQVCWTVFEMLR